MRREKKIENLFEEIMTENFPNLAKDIDIQARETQRIANKINPKTLTPRHIVIKIPNIEDKDGILKEEKSS